MRCAFVISLAVLGLGCASSPAPKWSLAESRCAADHQMIFSGDLETIYGRLRRILGERYGSVSDEPLLRQLRTGWHPVDADKREMVTRMGEQLAQVTRFEMRFTVRLVGEWPFRVQVGSQTRWRTELLVGDKPASLGGGRASQTLTRFEEELRQVLRVGLAEFAANCDGSMKAVDCAPRPAGEPTDFDPQAFAAPDLLVAAPRRCERNSAYVRVERPEGARRLGVARAHGQSGGFVEGCQDLPAPPEACSNLNVIAVLHEVERRLRRQGTTTGGAGLGPCGDHMGDYGAWNMSVIVMDWREVGRAVATIGQVMREYDLRGFVGVGVQARGDFCGVALSGSPD